MRRGRGEGPRTLSIGLFMSLEITILIMLIHTTAKLMRPVIFPQGRTPCFDNNLAQLVDSAVDAISKYVKARSLRCFVGGGMGSRQNQPSSVERA